MVEVLFLAQRELVISWLNSLGLQVVWS